MTDRDPAARRTRGGVVMRACDQWLRNDFLVRHGQEPLEPCGHDPADCPPSGDDERAATQPTTEETR